MVRLDHSRSSIDPFISSRLEVRSVQTEKTIPVPVPEITVDTRDDPAEKRPLSKSTTQLSEVIDIHSSVSII